MSFFSGAALPDWSASRGSRSGTASPLPLWWRPSWGSVWSISPIEALLEKVTSTMQEKSFVTRRLAKATISQFRQFCDRTGHRPSREMYVALGHAASTLAQCATGEAERVVYVSSLDPGVGKTQLCIEFLRALLGKLTLSHVSAIVCVARLTEVQSYVKRLGLSARQFAVYTGEKGLNASGWWDREQARILFTTQAMISLRCRGGSFEAVEDFHYQGKPRQVRIWDESILPGRPLTLCRDDIAFLFRPLRSAYPKLTNDIEQVFSDLKCVEDRGAFEMPDLEGRHGVSGSEVQALLGNHTRHQQDAASTLWLLFGKRVCVRREGNSNVALDYVETLPPDLTPIVAFDASARVRDTYRQWEEFRGSIRRLETAAKTYSNLTVKLLPRGGGKDSWRREGPELAAVIASTLDSVEGEALVVHHLKETIGIDTEAEVRSRMRTPNERVHFVTWGRHDATNDFAHVSTVVLAGSLFYPDSHREALGRLCAAIPPSNGPYPDEQMQAITSGETRNLILQALCRASVRYCEDGDCRPCTAYVIAAPKHRVHAELPVIFPGCNVELWEAPRRLRGKRLKAYDYVRSRLTGLDDGVILFREIQDAIGMADAANFSNRIRGHAAFATAMANLGLHIVHDGKQARGYALVDGQAIRNAA